MTSRKLGNCSVNIDSIIITKRWRAQTRLPRSDIGGLPNSVAVDHIGQFVCVVSEDDSSVSAFGIGSNGALEDDVPGSPFDTLGDIPVSVAVDPTGKFVYVANFFTNRNSSGVGTGNGNVSAFSIGSNGALTPVPGSAFLAGVNPCSVGISPLVPFA
jgi:6-phosphogluconolactonase